MTEGFRYATGPARTTFLGLPEADSTFEKSRVLVLPIPYDGTTSYRPGTRFGPQAILDASRYVETYDEELDLVPEHLGYCTLPEIPPAGTGADEMAERIYRAAAEILERAGDRFLLTLGGEHSVTPGIVRAVAERRPGLSVLHIDAHGDLRGSYEGSRYSHACACARIRDHVEKTVSVGIRAVSAEEARSIREEEIPVFWARDVVGRRDWIPEVVEMLSDEVYLTVDVDGLDPSIMPATGTPEPGGLGWYETLALFRAVAERRRIVAADIVELSPIPGMSAPDFLCARLAVKIVTYSRQAEIRALM
jgi:agmatinase